MGRLLGTQEYYPKKIFSIERLYLTWNKQTDFK